MMESGYKPFMDLMKTTYDMVFSEEKDGFTHQDAIILGVFKVTLDSLCAKLNTIIERGVNIWLVLLKNLN